MFASSPWRLCRALCSPLGLLFAAQVTQAIDLNIDDTQSIKDAASNAAYGSMVWYKGNETGQIPGAFPTKWWEGGALFYSLIEYWYFTGDDQYNEVIQQGMEWQAGEGDYMPANYSSYLGNDDQVFWGLAAMTAAELKFPDVKGKYSWLSLAQGVFNTQAGRWDTATCGGGLRWQIFPYQAGYAMKNTISNGGFFQLAARLARYTNNQTYTDWAEKVWDWTASTPLMNNETWQMADSTTLETNCKSQGNEQWSYNYGSYMAGAAYMYNYTSDEKWMPRTKGLLGVIMKRFFQNDIMTEYLCEPNEACNNNEILFKGLMSGWLAFTTSLIPSTYDTIMPKLKTSAIGAAKSCTGNGNNTCGVRWSQSKWDGWTGMEEQISATRIFSVNLMDTKKGGAGPVTDKTGGDSKSNPGAGGGSSNEDDDDNKLKPITTGDKAGAGILTALFLGVWASMVVWMVMAG